MNTSHEIDYEIHGHGIQLVEVELDPNETVIAEAGAMVYMDNSVQFETKMGDGSDPNQGFLGKLLSAGSRMLTGESVFMTHFTHRGHGKAKIAFSGQADFSGIMNDSSASIRVADMVHQAGIEVDESDIEIVMPQVAAAAANASSPVVRVNRPFLFFIREHHTGVILYAGAVQNPVLGRNSYPLPIHALNPPLTEYF